MKTVLEVARRRSASFSFEARLMSGLVRFFGRIPALAGFDAALILGLLLLTGAALALK